MKIAGPLRIVLFKLELSSLCHDSPTRASFPLAKLIFVTNLFLVDNPLDESLENPTSRVKFEEESRIELEA